MKHYLRLHIEIIDYLRHPNIYNASCSCIHAGCPAPPTFPIPSTQKYNLDFVGIPILTLGVIILDSLEQQFGMILDLRSAQVQTFLGPHLVDNRRKQHREREIRIVPDDCFVAEREQEDQRGKLEQARGTQ